MRSCLPLPLLLAASAVVSASILSRESVTPAAPNLPAAVLGKLHTISLEDAKAGMDLQGSEHNSTHSARRVETPTVLERDASSCAQNPNMRFEWKY